MSYAQQKVAGAERTLGVRDSLRPSERLTLRNAYAVSANSTADTANLLAYSFGDPLPTSNNDGFRCARTP